MRTFSILISLAAVFAAAIYVTLKLTAYGLPVERTLQARDGRTVEAVIVGKQGNTIYFERRDDGSRWDRPTHDLSLKDRIFALRLPEMAPPPLQESEPESENPYIATREALIRDLSKKRTMIQAELSSRTLSETLEQRRRTELAATDKEIRELQLSIQSYRYRTKQK